MNLSDLAAQYRRACMSLLVCRLAYYVHGEGVVTDAQYDEWEDHVRRFEEAYPALRHSKSPTQTIGSDNLADYPPSMAGLFRDSVSIDLAGYIRFFEAFGQLVAKPAAKLPDWLD